MSRIAIVGSQGWVGREMVKLFEKENPVLYDEPVKIGSRKDVNMCQVAFVCVPTPMRLDGSCDFSIVEEVVGWISCPLIVIRSTIPPGTTEALCKKYGKKLVMNPEYIGETVDHPLMNSQQRKFLILGGEKSAIQKCIEVYQKVYNAGVHIYQCTSTEAELIKYCENSFIGTYVTFCNEFYEICKSHNADWNTVREGFLMDPRMTRYWTFVYPDNRGFSGKCIPKDLNGIVAASKSRGYTPQFLASVIKANDRFRAPPKISIESRYVPHEEIRVNVSPYEEYYECLKEVFDLNTIRSFCDVGCANGPLLNAFHRQYPDKPLYGIEYFQYHKDAAPESVKNMIHIADLRDDIPIDTRYDIVNCTEVAEHIDPAYQEQFLRNIDKLVGKYLIMTWSCHPDDPNKAVETHQHFNPLPMEKYREIMRQRGYTLDIERSEKFVAHSKRFQNFYFWWRESLSVWVKDV